MQRRKAASAPIRRDEGAAHPVDSPQAALAWRLAASWLTARKTLELNCTLLPPRPVLQEASGVLLQQLANKEPDATDRCCNLHRLVGSSDHAPHLSIV